jgi:hypothetical protein
MQAYFHAGLDPFTIRRSMSLKPVPASITLVLSGIHTGRMSYPRSIFLCITSELLFTIHANFCARQETRIRTAPGG